jgi:hypothetical protein
MWKIENAPVNLNSMEISRQNIEGIVHFSLAFHSKMKEMRNK